jgi:hypothetical protein
MRRLTKFDLDFPGGSPRELVAAIQKAMGRPLNALVPDDFNSVKLPPLMMKNVDVAELFKALELGSLKTESYTYGGGGYGNRGTGSVQTSYGFKTQGELSDDSIWCFYAHRAPVDPGASIKISRFSSMAPYLELGLTVDDITTAVETGWKMLGETSQPAISFHKDTKLLIAVGEPSELETIDAALQALAPPKPQPGPSRVPNRAPSAAPAATPAEKPKANE